MALWQFTFRIVPKKAFMRAEGQIPISVSYEKFRDLPMWDASSKQNQLFQLIDASFPRNDFQDKNNISWGRPEETDFSFFYDEHNLVDFTVRLDLRSLKKETLILIEQIGKLLGAVIVTEQGSVIEPNKKLLLENIKLSKAFKFIRDPRGFFGSNQPSE